MMSQKAAMNKIWGIWFSLIDMAGMAEAVRCKGWVRRLEGGQGEVRGACQLTNSWPWGMCTPPYPSPNCPTWTPPPPSRGPPANG